MDNIENTDKIDNIENINNMDNFIGVEYFLFHKRIKYKDKIVENYYCSKYLIIYKYYDIKHNVLRKKIIIYKNDKRIYCVEKYSIDGELI